MTQPTPQPNQAVPAEPVTEPVDDILSLSQPQMVLKIYIEGIQAEGVSGIGAIGAVEIDLQRSV